MILALGKLIERERIARGMQVNELVRASGLSRTTIYRFESGDRMPTVSQLECIARAFNVSGWELMRLATCPNGNTALHTGDIHATVRQARHDEEDVCER